MAAPPVVAAGTTPSVAGTTPSVAGTTPSVVDLALLKDVQIHSSTKDSISVQWRTRSEASSVPQGVHGFRVEYQVSRTSG